jgi:hypothetical protein
MNCLPDEKRVNGERAEYEAPAVIFESEINTRAGSTLSNPTGVDDIDPADLFSD